MSTNGRPRRVIVVGAGISGLAAAHALATSGRPLDVTVLEASDRAGGKLMTIDLDGMPVEAGADSFVVRKPWAVELCRELGLGDQVVIPGAWGAFVWTRAKLVAYPERSPFGIPSEVGELLRWQGLPRGPKLRAAQDLIRPPLKDAGDEALGRLLRRRLGARASRVLVEPLLGGLHAADPMRLSALATFPELKGWERTYGSLIRGAKAAVEATGEEKGHKPLFATVWGGLSRLAEALVRSIGTERVRLGHHVSTIERGEEGFLVGSEGAKPSPADAVILASPSTESARMLEQLNAEAAGELAAIPYTSTAVVFLAYPPGSGARLPQGTGFVVPQGVATMTACTWVSRKWPAKEFGGRAVIRCFVGRSGDETALALSDEELTIVISREVEQVTPLGVEPTASRVVRWDRSMPHYEVGHLDRVARIEQTLAATPGLFVTGSAFRGVGISDCVRQGREAADRALQHINQVDRVTADVNRQEATWTS